MKLQKPSTPAVNKYVEEGRTKKKLSSSVSGTYLPSFQYSDDDFRAAE
jgi:hypothetical protein